MKHLNKLEKRQRGVSSVGWIGIAGIFGFLIITFFKVFPMYYANFKVQSALESIQQDTKVDPKSKRAIWDSLKKRLYIDEVKTITRENVTMVRSKDGVTTVTVTYEMRDNYIGNLFIGAQFEESIEIRR